MGFFKRRREGEQSQTAEALTLHAAGTVEVVGESFRQDALERVAKIAPGPEPYLEDLEGRARSRTRNAKLLWFRAALVREPNNPHDRNAIAVHASGVGQVGYLDRETAILYRPVFDELARQGVAVGACPAFVTGEPAVTTLGGVLCPSSPEAVVRDLRGE